MRFYLIQITKVSLSQVLLVSSSAVAPLFQPVAYREPYLSFVCGWEGVSEEVVRRALSQKSEGRLIIDQMGRWNRLSYS